LPDQTPVERRRANRVRSGPLRVQLDAGPAGTLIDLNEFGALLELPAPHDVTSHVTFDLYWEGVPVRLHGRVVRTTPCFDSDARVAWGEPASYHVAVEFFDLADQCAITLHDVVLKLSRRSEGLTLPDAGGDKR
jgi:hypothetical protein